MWEHRLDWNLRSQEKTADDDNKESVRSLERQDIDVRFPEMERVRSPKRPTEDDLDDEDTREHKRQTAALISEIPRFTIGVICTATVYGDVPVSRKEDTEEIVEEMKLVEPQLDYIEDEFAEQEVIDGIQIEMKSMKSFNVYDEIPVEHCSQEDIDNALDGTWVKRRKTATKVRCRLCGRGCFQETMDQDDVFARTQHWSHWEYFCWWLLQDVGLQLHVISALRFFMHPWLNVYWWNHQVSTIQLETAYG